MKEAIVIVVCMLGMMATLCYAIYHMATITEDVIEERENK